MIKLLLIALLVVIIALSGCLKSLSGSDKNFFEGYCSHTFGGDANCFAKLTKLCKDAGYNTYDEVLEARMFGGYRHTYCDCYKEKDCCKPDDENCLSTPGACWDPETGCLPSLKPRLNLCSNPEYSTESTHTAYSGNITLSYESRQKLARELKTHGNSALEKLSDLNCLEELSLDFIPEVTDISALNKLTNLKDLGLLGTGVLDISSLQNMQELQSLTLSDTPISDISPLAKLTNLRTLLLHDTPISNITPLQSLVNLESLYLNGTNVSDISALGNLSSLEWLSLKDTNISDITPLQNLIGLRRLVLSGTKVQHSDCGAMKKNLPNLYCDFTQ